MSTEGWNGRDNLGVLVCGQEAKEKDRHSSCSKYGLSSTTMALITSECGQQAKEKEARLAEKQKAMEMNESAQSGKNRAGGSLSPEVSVSVLGRWPLALLPLQPFQTAECRRSRRAFCRSGLRSTPSPPRRTRRTKWRC